MSNYKLCKYRQATMLSIINHLYVIMVKLLIADNFFPKYMKESLALRSYLDKCISIPLRIDENKLKKQINCDFLNLTLCNGRLFQVHLKQVYVKDMLYTYL